MSGNDKFAPKVLNDLKLSVFMQNIDQNKQREFYSLVFSEG